MLKTTCTTICGNCLMNSALFLSASESDHIRRYGYGWRHDDEIMTHGIVKVGRRRVDRTFEFRPPSAKHSLEESNQDFRRRNIHTPHWTVVGLLS